MKPVTPAEQHAHAGAVLEGLTGLDGPSTAAVLISALAILTASIPEATLRASALDDSTQQLRAVTAFYVAELIEGGAYG